MKRPTITTGTGRWLNMGMHAGRVDVIAFAELGDSVGQTSHPDAVP
jgi:hypothetical protein